MAKAKKPFYQTIETATRSVESARFMVQEMIAEFELYSNCLIKNGYGKERASTINYMQAISSLIDNSRACLSSVNSTLLSIDNVIRDELTEDTKKFLSSSILEDLADIYQAEKEVEEDATKKAENEIKA